MISTSVPCSSLAMRRRGVLVNSNLRYPKPMEAGPAGGGSLCLVGDHDRLEIPLTTPSEERPRGACLGVSEGPRRVASEAAPREAGLAAQAFRGSAQAPSEPLVDGLSWHRGYPLRRADLGPLASDPPPPSETTP